MANYTINFTDPLSPSITLFPKSVDGPGSATANTSLRLHGDGYVNWGEAVNENFVRLLENFMGATAPINPTTGQLWVDVQLYYHDTVSGVFYRYDIDPSSPTYKTWVVITVTSQATAPTEIIGAYWFDTVNSTLKYFESAYDTYPASWMVRSHESGTVAPTSAPVYQLKMYNASIGASGSWTASPVVLVSSSTTAPADDRVGTLRYDPVANTLNVWVGSAWVPLLDSATPVLTGDLDAATHKIINLGDATNATDALNLQTGDARYVNIAGDTLTGALTLSGNPTLALHAAPKQYVESWAAPVSHTHLLANITDAGTAAAVNVGTASGDVPLTSSIVGKQSIWVPAAAMSPRGDNGADWGSYTNGTNFLTLKTLDFDPATKQYASFSVQMPKSWNESTVTAKLVWMVQAGTGNNVVWGLSALGMGDSESLSTAFSAEVSVADSAPTYTSMYHTTESTAISIAGTPAAGDVVAFQVSRLVSDVNDVHTGDARLIGITIFYNTDALNDA